MIDFDIASTVPPLMVQNLICGQLNFISANNGPPFAVEFVSANLMTVNTGFDLSYSQIACSD